MKKILVILILTFAFADTYSQNVEAILSLNEYGAEAQLNSFVYDENGALYTILSFNYDNNLDTNDYVILNYPNGRDTIYYKFKERIHLIKLTKYGNLIRQGINIQDGLKHDFNHYPSPIHIHNNEIYFSILRVQYSGGNTLLITKRSILKIETLLVYLQF